MQKSLDIFKAEPQSVFDVLCDKKNTGFYMPAYQRPYSWEETHIRDLFSDCENVFRNLLESPDAIIFLGSILSVDDSGATTIFPIAKRQIPTHIKLIIDGQQRLSTLMLIILCLNERLRVLLPNLKKSIETEDNDDALDTLESLREIVSQLIIDTSNFSIETTAEHTVYKYFPKIIRSQVDCWGKDENKAVYESPISQLLITYQRHVIEQSESVTFKPLDLSLMSDSDSAKRVVNNIKEIRKQLNCVQDGFEFKLPDGDIEEKLTINDFLDKETLDLCLDFPIDADLLSVAEKNKKIEQIVYIVAFTKFLLHRVCLTYVEVNNESYAFDMFEALNTTGEPLTAIETFVPKVIEYIGIKRKDGELEENLKLSLATLNSITDRFENIIKSKEKNDKTKALILAFVRAYQGKVKVTSLRDQRDAMLKSYENCSYGNKDDYLNYLAVTSEFLFDHWQAEIPDVKKLVVDKERDISNVCLRYLVDMKHDIVLSLLVQFILQDKKYENTGTEYSSFEAVLKAVTAFSILWRAMSGGADGIDGVYKKLHEKGIDGYKAYKLSNGTLDSEQFSVDAIKTFFKKELADKIDSKGSLKDKVLDKWIDICSKQQMLTKSKSIKLLVLAAFNNLELKSTGFERVDRIDTQYMTPLMWELISNKDRIKRVYSGSKEALRKWNNSDISDPQVYNKLGNILVDARNSVSQKSQESWYDLKQHMLEALNNESIKEINTILRNEGDLSESARKNVSILMLEKKYSEITWADNWDKTAIDERTEVLLMNAWLNLSQWLDWE
ncbi:hypothetical protein CTM91_07415 [Photobacterium aquimaris]|uniref:DUF262 domain-containing protein n=1 Tax=Photobacterium TaxID=657 RepID=UPI000D15C12D|nr:MULTISPECIES: DUF262 domain-containing protein [Photobacterium]PSW01481.1 hypothetical protein CTM91_07415 [Photobacterium aquimaris]